MNSQNNRFPKQTLCYGEMTLVGSHCDAQKTECHLKWSAKNVQSKQHPSANVKVRNIFQRQNNITCNKNCKYRTAATLHTPETCFVSGI